MLTNRIRDFYSDGIVHANGELYKCMNAHTEEDRHVIRGTQQVLKQQDWLIHVGYGKWMVNPQRIMMI